MGVATVIGQASSMGLQAFLLMVGFITINLGVMNLIPIPALDGGRLLFILIEMIFRRPVNRKIENAMILTGMALLMTFMAVVLWNDIRFLLP